MSAAAVKAANRRLYDAVAGDYEKIDGRRNDALLAWIRQRLEALAAVHGNRRLVDIGSGSGLIPRAARGLFRETVALDLSPKILAAAGPIADHRLAADCDALPLADACVDVVTCFAVLHHLYDAAGLAREAARILRPGGAFWSDHDMDAAFYRRFRRPLEIYRRVRGADRHYARGEEVDEQTYALAEYRENGVDSPAIISGFQQAGMRIHADYHWYGLAPLTNRLFGRRRTGRGWSPLLSIVAVKERIP